MDKAEKKGEEEKGVLIRQEKEVCVCTCVR